MKLTLAELAAQTAVELSNEQYASLEISAVAPIQSAGKGQISFIANPKYKKHLENSHADAVILHPSMAEDYEGAALISSNPYATYARIATLLNPAFMPSAQVHPAAVVDPSAIIGDGCYIGPHCVVEADAVIGDNCYLAANVYIGRGASVGSSTRLNANVTIYHQCKIGKRVIIHSSAVIGADGFGFANEEGRWIKVPQTGAVDIADDVEIGASTTIDRGALDDTVIEEGVKLDNQIQVAHNVRIGAHTAIAGCTGIAGSTRIGKHCTIAGMCTIVGHIELVDHVHITAMSLISKSIDKPGSYSSGTGFEETASWRKNSVRYKQLDDISRRLKKLEKQS